MKNLQNIEKLESLPQREKIRNPDGWGGSGSTYHPVDGLWPWERVKHLCKSNIGRSFDKVFSMYCKQVPVYQQDYFMAEFRKKRWPGDFYVDSQGRIQKTKKPRKDKRVRFYSDDYKTEKRHKVTGAAYPTYGWLDKRFKEEDYEYVIISGYCLEFSSRNDPEWIRLTTDQSKRKRAWSRKNKREKEYSFVSKSEKDKKAEKAKDKVKIEAKGFDYLTSFRNDKSIHPDLIKEGQGLKKDIE